MRRELSWTGGCSGAWTRPFWTRQAASRRGPAVRVLLKPREDVYQPALFQNVAVRSRLALPFDQPELPVLQLDSRDVSILERATARVEVAWDWLVRVSTRGSLASPPLDVRRLLLNALRVCGVGSQLFELGLQLLQVRPGAPNGAVGVSGDEDELALPHRLIIFSDQHKGAGDGADEFRQCRSAYEAALQHYRGAGFTLVLLGDVEELWEQGFGAVRRTYDGVLKLEGSFPAARYYRLWGNHDDEWMSDRKVRKRLAPYMPTAGVYEGLRFEVPRTSSGATRFSTWGKAPTTFRPSRERYRYR